MKKLVLTLSFLMIQPAFAENTEVIKCKIANNDWQATVVVDSLGGGILKFQKSGDPAFYACSMKMTSFSDVRGGVVPMISTSLRLGACDPVITAYRDKILSTIYLDVKVRGSAATEGKIQWLQDRQPETCRVERIKLDDMQEYSQLWAKGKWGRRPASAPDKLKKKF
jgi:hypothetical protein